MNGEKKKSQRMYSLYLYVAVAAGLLLSSCSGALTEKEKSAHSVFITISSDRTVRPEMTAVTEWTVTAVRSGAETDSSTFTLAGEGGSILLKEGTYTLSLTGTNDQGITFSGETDGIVVGGTGSLAVVITVTPALAGLGSLDYTMTLTGAFATEQELSAMLLSVEPKEEIRPISLTVTVEDGAAHITGQNISAGYYNLVVLYNEVNLAAFTDSLIEIVGKINSNESIENLVNNAKSSSFYAASEPDFNVLIEKDEYNDKSYNMINNDIINLSSDELKNISLLIEDKLYSLDKRIVNVTSAGLARYNFSKCIINSNGVCKEENKNSITYYAEVIATQIQLSIENEHGNILQ